MPTDYQKRESRAVDAIKKAIPDSLRKDIVAESQGMFAELYENNEILPNHYIACAIDGVGTKIIIAEAMWKFDTIGIDCVAMNANDLATLGNASPFLFMDYLACQSKILEKKITGEIIKGISRGLEQCDASSILKNSIKVNFGKGETSSVDELIGATKQGYGFDVAGCMLGFIQKEKLKKQKISIGDKIIALKSSGLHSNGYTAARHILLNGNFESRKEYKKLYKGKFSLNDDFENSTIGEALLEPTKIYIKDIARISKNFDVIGVNNTGYGLKNLNRIKGFNFIVDEPIKPLPIFDLIKKEGMLDDKKMYSTFNMGMGFFIIAKKENAGDILQLIRDSQVVGEVKKSDSGKATTILELKNKKIIFEGY